MERNLNINTEGLVEPYRYELSVIDNVKRCGTNKVTNVLEWNLTINNAGLTGV